MTTTTTATTTTTMYELSKLRCKFQYVWYAIVSVSLAVLLLLLHPPVLNEASAIWQTWNFDDIIKKVTANDRNYSKTTNTHCTLGLEDVYWTQNKRKFRPPDCAKVLFDNQPSSYKTDVWNPAVPHTDQSILSLVSDCKKLRKTFPSEPRSLEEAEFPLAYTFVGEQNAAQTLRLFRLLYWPQNVYCLTPNNRSSSTYGDFLTKLADCFPENVLLNRNPINADVEQRSLFHNTVLCLQLLIDSGLPWRYVQMVTFDAFPLKTNLEMVRILRLLNDSNDSALLGPRIRQFSHKYITDKKLFDRRKPISPSKLMMYKGGYASTLTREFVRFSLENPPALRFLEWLNDTWCPEDHFWSTLIHNPFFGAPGSFPGQCMWFYMQQKTYKNYISRCQITSSQSFGSHKCKGKYIHFVCIYGVDDIRWLTARSELMASRFHSNYQPAGQYCLEQWHWKKTCAADVTFVEDRGLFYANLSAVRYQRIADKDMFLC